MVIRSNWPILVLLLGIALQGCSSTPHFDYGFGSATQDNLSAQILDPAAAANKNPALGIDGKTAHAVQERYQRSFTEIDAGADRSLVGNGTK